MSEEKSEAKKLKAKTVSLFAKIVAALVVLAGGVLKWIGIFANCSIDELCLVGFTVMGIFGTVDLNLLAEKFSKYE